MNHQRKGGVAPWLSLAVDDWPLAIRLDFETAFPEDGVDAIMLLNVKALRPKTRLNVQASIALFQKTLADRFPQHVELPLSGQVTADTVQAFSETLLETNAALSVVDHLSRLLCLARRLQCGAACAIIERERDLTDHPHRPKHVPGVTTRQLVEAGESIMSGALARTKAVPHGRNRASYLRRTAELYRDGLLLTFAALCPLRLANVLSMALGEHLFRTEGGYRLYFNESEMKARRAMHRKVPTYLTPAFDCYFEHFRPYIQGAGAHAKVWASRMGDGLSPVGTYRIFVDNARTLLGQHVTPHDYRRCGGNAAAGDVSARPDLAQVALDHKRGSKTERYITVRRTRGGAELNRLTGC